MKKNLLVLAIATAMIFSFASCATSGLSEFGAEMGAQSNPVPGGDPIRVPYTSSVKYFGYVQPGTPADEEVGGKKLYYLYVWIPLVAPEIGVRMFSPVADLIAPVEGDIVSANYEEGISADPESYFDTWITFERAVSVTDPEQIISGAKSTEWLRYSTNDDSSEMPKQPSGSSYNSLMRLEASSEPLVRGLYRVGFTTYKVGEVKGSFYAEIGAPIDLPGVEVAKTLEDLVEKINNQE